jgi:putative ABC transport system permease protein
LHHATARFALLMGGAGLVLILLAALLCHPAISSRSPFFGFAGAFCTLSGFALLSPLFTLHFARQVAPLCSWVFGVEGVLAATQLQRALNRSSLVIASLMVSLAMAVGMAVMVGSFRASVERWVTTSIRGDLYVSGATGFSGDSGPGLPPEVVAYTLASPSVKVVDSIRGAGVTLVSRLTGRPQPVSVAANDLPALRTHDRGITFVETAHGEAAALAAHLDAKGILVSERFKNLLGYGAGDTVSLPTPSGPKAFSIAGVFYDYTPDQAVIYLPRPLYRKYWHDNSIDALAVHLKPGFTVDALRNQIQSRFARKYQLTLLSNAAIRKTVFTTFDNTFRVTYALQLIAVLVAAVGIFETLWSLILERRREIATMRAMGASIHQITKATLVEFGLIGLAGWILGMLAGLLLAWQLIFVINRQFFGWTIGWNIPPAVPVQTLVLALAASLGAGIVPSLRAARQKIALGLQRE